MIQNKLKVTKSQSIFFLVNILSFQIYISFPRYIAEIAKTAGWLFIVYIAFIVLIWLLIVFKLYKGFEGLDILDISEYAGGTTLKIITGMVIGTGLMFLLTLNLRQFVEDIKVTLLNFSPLSFILATFILAIILTSFIGIESLFRVQAFFVPILALAFFVLVFSSYSFFNLDNLLPILGSGLNDIFVKNISKTSIFSCIILLFLLPPFLSNKKDFKSIGYISVIISSMFMIISNVIYIAVIAYPVALEHFIPFYEIALLISIGRFFQKIESVFVFSWAIALMLYSSSLFYFIILVFRKTFNLRYHTPLIIPFGLILFSSCFLPESLLSSISLDVNICKNYGWIPSFGLILLILIIAKFSKKSKLRRRQV